MRETRGRPARPGVAVIGIGNWGSSLAHALYSARTPLKEVLTGLRAPGNASSPSRTIARRRTSSPPSRLPLVALADARLDAEILWLCVPDSAIAEVARRLVLRARQVDSSGQPLRGRIVVHSSGALAAAVLEPAARAGASIAAVHPVMTFPTHTPVALSGVFFGIEAETAVRRKLFALVRELGGRPFAIATSGKAFYHIMGMLSSPLLVSLIAAAQDAGSLAGLAPGQSRRLIASISQATLKNAFSQGLPKSFSGPLARGDLAAIHLHLEALAEHPMLANLYRSLALYSLEALTGSGKEKVRRLLAASITRKRSGPDGGAPLHRAPHA